MNVNEIVTLISAATTIATFVVGIVLHHTKLAAKIQAIGTTAEKVVPAVLNTGLVQEMKPEQK